MSQLNVCLKLCADISSGKDQNLLEDNYQKIFKKALTFLFSHPDFYLSVAFTGPQFDYYEKKHPEAIGLLKDLLARRQIEIIGGGYYAPIFPLLTPSDRAGQIEKMSLSLRMALGKRPVGMYIFGSVWDPSLVTSFDSCGINYLFLDSGVIPAKNLSCMPIITSNQGKSLKILPCFKNLLPEPEENKKEWTKRILKFYEKNRVMENSYPVVSVAIDFDYFGVLLESGFLNSVFDFNLDSNLQEKTLRFILPQMYFSCAEDFVSAYIPAGMENRISRWATNAYESKDNLSGFPLTIYDFLNVYPQNKRLYERMMHVAMLIFQCKGGDKIRRQTATQSLWAAQSGINFVSVPLGVPAVAEKRHGAWRLLNDCERIIRESSENFKESLTSFDYNSDGLKEYVASMDRYSCVISLKGAQVFELNPVRNSSNYAASLSSIDKFDGLNDNYNRGMFVEHFGLHSQLKDYLDHNVCVSPLFSQILFRERKVNNKKREIFLEGRGMYSEQELPILLKKNITFSSSGLIVQYILKNESEETLDGFFACELNFCQTRFEKNYAKGEQYSVELVNSDGKKVFDPKKKFQFTNGVSFVQVTDVADKRNFVIEPNEEAGFSCSVLSFKRPSRTEEPEEISRTLTSSLFWNIKLAPGMEKEKTIFLSIVPMRK